MTWVPMVTGRDGISNSNHWLNATRDWLWMGQPSDIHAEYPARLWADVREALVDRGYDVESTLFADGRDIQKIPSEQGI